MNCDEIQRLYDAWLDSELDARTTMEVERHLESCAECAREFASRKALDTPIMACLRQGQETSTLWRAIEDQVLSSPKDAPVRRPSPSRGIRQRWASLGQYVRTGLRPSPAAWAGLAAVWVVILSLHGAAREAAAPPSAAAPTPSAAELRMALWQKRLLMADFAESVASSKTGEGEPATPGPRTDSSTIQPFAVERFMI